MKLTKSQENALQQMLTRDAVLWYGGFYVSSGGRENAIHGRTIGVLVHRGLIDYVRDIKPKFTLTEEGRKLAKGKTQ